MIGVMVAQAAPLRAHLRPLLRMAGPVVLAELGWMSMGLVDTIMVGPLGPAAIGAVGLGSSLFVAVAIFAMGLMLGLDTLVSQACGARLLHECHAWLFTALALAILLGLPMTAGLLWGAPLIGRFGLHADVEPLVIPYFRTLIWGLLPLLTYASFRRYLQGMSLVRPVTFALVSANLVNIGGNWALIYGHAGLPALGTIGAAWATDVSRLYMATVLAGAALLHDRRTRGGLRHGIERVSWARLGRLFRLGLPAALQVTLEVGVFAAATALAGRLDPIALASHQIALNIASFVFMVPLGLASASAVLVGQHVGRRDPAGAGRAGWTALAAIAVFMLAVAIVFLAAPRVLVAAFSQDERVLALGSTLLAVAAVFQVFDGWQAVATGTLRGLGDTRTPMVLNLAGHWGLGLPVGWTLCFAWQLGVVGLWLGLSVGLVFVGVTLILVWKRRVHALTREVASQAPAVDAVGGPL